MMNCLDGDSKNVVKVFPASLKTSSEIDVHSIEYTKLQINLENNCLHSQPSTFETETADCSALDMPTKTDDAKNTTSAKEKNSTDLVQQGGQETSDEYVAEKSAGGECNSDNIKPASLKPACEDSTSKVITSVKELNAITCSSNTSLQSSSDEHRNHELNISSNAVPVTSSSEPIIVANIKNIDTNGCETQSKQSNALSSVDTVMLSPQNMLVNNAKDAQPGSSTGTNNVLEKSLDVKNCPSQYTFAPDCMETLLKENDGDDSAVSTLITELIESVTNDESANSVMQSTSSISFDSDSIDTSSLAENISPKLCSNSSTVVTTTVSQFDTCSVADIPTPVSEITRNTSQIHNPSTSPNVSFENNANDTSEKLLQPSPSRLCSLLDGTNAASNVSQSIHVMQSNRDYSLNCVNTTVSLAQETAEELPENSNRMDAIITEGACNVHTAITGGELNKIVDKKTASQIINVGASGSILHAAAKSKPTIVELSEKRKQNLLEIVKSTKDSVDNMSVNPNDSTNVSYSNVTANGSPLSFPAGLVKRKPFGEAFSVKSFQSIEGPTKSTMPKTKIRPVFGHVSVANMLKERGPFPVVYIGAPNVPDTKAKVVQEANRRQSAERSNDPIDLTEDASSAFVKKDESKNVNLDVADACKTDVSDTKDKEMSKNAVCRAVASTSSQISSSHQSAAMCSTIDNIVSKPLYSPSLPGKETSVLTDSKEYSIKEAMTGFLGGFENNVDLPKRPNKMSTGPLYYSEFNALPSMVLSNSNIFPHAQSENQSCISSYHVNNIPSGISVPPTNLSYKLWSNKNYPKPFRMSNNSSSLNLTVSSGISPKPVTTVQAPVYLLPFSKSHNFDTVNSKLSILKPKSLPTVSVSASTIISTVKVPASSITKPIVLATPSVSTSTPSFLKTFAKHLEPSNLLKSVKQKVVDKNTPNLIAAVRKPQKRKAELLTESIQDPYPQVTKKINLLQNLQNKALKKTTFQSASSTNTSTVNISTSKIKKHKRPGVLVKFEDGVKLWIDKLRDLMHLDDEPVKSWSLKPGLEVAAKYTDGLFYDAVILTAYDGVSSVHLKAPETSSKSGVAVNRVVFTHTKPMAKQHSPAADVESSVKKQFPGMPGVNKRKQVGRRTVSNKHIKLEQPTTEEKSKPEETLRVCLKKLPMDEVNVARPKKTTSVHAAASQKESSDSDNNGPHVKCSKCFLVFKETSMFWKHNRTVCGSNGVPVTGFIFEPGISVKVDESGIPPLVKSHQVEKADESEGKPRTSVGRRCFRRGTWILHRWQTANGSRWFNGKILRLLKTNKDDKSEFEVEYIDDDHDSGPYAIFLYEDYPHDIRIVTR